MGAASGKKISLLAADDTQISYTNKTRVQVAEKPGCYTILTKDCYTINVVFVYNDPVQKVRRC